MALSIRTRLSVWYLAVLCASLAVLGCVIFWGAQKSVARIIDSDLRARLKAAQLFMGQQIPNAEGKDLQDEFLEYSSGHPGGELLQISDESHHWIFQSPSIQPYGIDASSSSNLDAEQSRYSFQTLGPLRVISGGTVLSGRHYFVQIGADISKFNLFLQQLKLLLLISTPLAIGLALAGGYWLSGRALKPVKQITERARLIGAEELSQRLEVPQAADEMRLLAETLNQMLERIESAFTRITQFTADASHELRTPVAIMRTTAEVTLRHPREASQYREALITIVDEAERTGQLIDDLLALARLDSIGQRFAMQSTNLADVIEATFAKAKSLAEGREIALSLKIDRRDIYVDGDAQALARMFLALFDNAVKYTPVGGTVIARFDVGGNAAVFEIRDSGIGIPAAALPHLFERFYRADAARNREHGGFGLGLAIAKAIANAHQADIQVESVQGSGSTFKITFLCTSQTESEVVSK